MMKTICNICKKKFTRDWNLKRHMFDVHNIVNEPTSDNLIHETKESLNHRRFHNNSFDNQSMNYNNSQFQANSYSYNNDISADPFTNIYMNDRSFANSFIPSPFSEPKRLNLDDKIRIQKILKNLENFLTTIFPKQIVFFKIKYLKDQCYRDQSDEPLKRYLVKKHLGYLWSN